MVLTQTAWLALGAAALVVSLLSITMRHATSSETSGLLVRTTGSAVSMFLWWIFAINAFDYVTYTQDGTEIAHSAPSIGYLAVILGVLMLLDLFLTVLSALGIDWSSEIGGPDVRQ